MSWRDSLRPASFRGAPFFVGKTGGQGGRRLAKHEYPLRDEPFQEDMGRATRQFTLSGYVLGDDYMPARDALIRACEAPGPGTLVHPYRGELQVALETFSYSETAEEGGICRFDLSFVEAGERKFPAPAVNTRNSVFAAADQSTEASLSAFDQIYEWLQLPDFVIQTAVNGVADLAAVLAGQVQSVTSVPTELAADFADATRRLAVTTESIVRSADLGSTLAGTLSLFRLQTADAAQAMRGLQALRDWQVSILAPVYQTAMRDREAANAAAITALVREVAVAEQARAATSRPLSSYQEAVAVRDALVADLEEVIVGAGDRGDDNAYLALTGLQATVTEDLTQRGANLKRIVFTETGRSLPSLVVAHRLYQDIDRESDLIGRNPSPHPGWMKRRLETLSQ
ncbi:DNA circularization protein [Dongia soli]|uniref:DNA circularization N-terminal domain-containing protein n=1 Tax=Dongia soli TaxID=600628 RepID=A0ABU5E7K9_9PROT|nr:DNA circularization N-terminal domain-containing protein [Dongia soli]MDY0882310.1 DNA circularization N-terminal domain-containing protein [Dongia soli]